MGSIYSHQTGQRTQNGPTRGWPSLACFEEGMILAPPARALLPRLRKYPPALSSYSIRGQGAITSLWILSTKVIVRHICRENSNTCNQRVRVLLHNCRSRRLSFAHDATYVFDSKSSNKIVESPPQRCVMRKTTFVIGFWYRQTKLPR